MCRVFGFRSVIQSQVHHSLVSADNAIALQSSDHPDGWGVAYYVSSVPHLIKAESTAIDDHLFKKVSGVVSSETVVAHIRKATSGKVHLLNTHPFQYGPWIFAHNGNIKDFEKHREELLSLISPDLKRFILGETDSEVLFYLLLTHLSTTNDLAHSNIDVKQIHQACQAALTQIMGIVGPYHTKDNGPSFETYLTFLITNGTSMLAHQGGKNLFYSTYKNRCIERDTCASFNACCEAKTTTGFVNHLIFSSEPLSGENIWLPMENGQYIGVDKDMKLVLY